jgi:uncharacterized protein (TIGR03000 family)
MKMTLPSFSGSGAAARAALALTCTLAALGLLAAAHGQPPGGAQRAYLRVLLPEKDAKVLIDGHKTKQTGAARLFASPPLEPGQSFTYTVTAKWEPNNYTEVIRTRRVPVKAGDELEVDLRKPDPKNPDRFLIRFVPTPEEVVEAMCKLARVGKDDVVYDLGCGDGRIVISAVKDFGARRGVGVDIDSTLVELSRTEAKSAGVSDRVKFRQDDVLNIKDLSDATVVMMYMGEDVNLRLRPILKKTLRPGARIVSHDFKMGDWKPEKTVEITDSEGIEHEIYLWTIPPKKQ